MLISAGLTSTGLTGAGNFDPAPRRERPAQHSGIIANPEFDGRGRPKTALQTRNEPLFAERAECRGHRPRVLRGT